MPSKGLYYNINKRKKAGTSRSKSKSTISDESYANMRAWGFGSKESARKFANNNKKSNRKTMIG